MFPLGLEADRKDLSISSADLDHLAIEGVNWLIKRGFGWPEDAAHCEDKVPWPTLTQTKFHHS